MLKIKKFIEDNYRKYYFALAINIFLFIFFNSFFYCRYHTVDDVFMEMFACGAYGVFDPHLIYSSVILGFPLSLLYSISTKIPWYGLMHIIMAVLSFSTILYVFFNRNNRYVKILVLIAVFIVSYEAYTKVQFTKTAAYLASAGYILISFSLEGEERLIKQLCGVLFLLNSFMLRTGMFLGSSAVLLGCLMPKIIDYLRNFKNSDKRKDFFNLVKVGVCSLLVVGCAYFIDSLAYRSEEWTYYKKFNTYTTQFQDINMPDYDEFEKEYNALGLDRDDIRLYNGTDHNDPDLFDLEKMEKVKQLQPYKVINLDEFVMFVLRGYNTLFKQKSLATFTTLTIALLLLFVLDSKYSWNSWLSLIYTGLATFAAFAYTYFMHGWFDRTTLAVMSAVIFTILYILDLKENRFTKVFVYIFLVVSIIGSMYIWSEYYRFNMNDWKAEYELNHEVLDEIHSDQDHLYISRTSLPLWKRYYTPYDEIKVGAMANYSPLGDWIANNPLLVRTLANYGVRNPYKDIVNNDKVYFIAEEGDLDRVILYISKHYHPGVEAKIVRNSGPYIVYSLVAQ